MERGGQGELSGVGTPPAKAPSLGRVSLTLPRVGGILLSFPPMGVNYKDTLNLPKSEFPMKAGLVQREPEMLQKWEAQKLYDQIQQSRKDAPSFVLHDGPPFANGDVHIGTALNKIIKDFIVKSRSMMGFRAPYVPGWDCHGLPIEYKVVRSDSNLTPVQVRQKSEEFARKYIDIQRKQFKRLGVLGDWENPYLTLDRKYEAEILRALAEVVGKGLVYQGKKPVYWSTGCQTALAEAEVEYADKQSPAVYVKFEVVGMSPKTSVVIWTTTPWTLPANLAVAINPRLKYGVYERAGERLILCDSLTQATYEFLGVQKIESGAPELTSDRLLELKLKHPFLSREVPILAGDFVGSDTGTGCVHIAPGHGQDDYNLAKHLGLLSPVDDHGRFTSECGVPEWVGQYVFDANKLVIAHLKKLGALVAEETIQHSYPHCWRSKTPVVFRAVEQWFIRVGDLKEKALEEISKVQWVPAWGENRIRGTVEARSDWCISRQRSWGVPLPIFYKPSGEAIVDREVILRVASIVEKEGTNVWFEKSAAELASLVGLPSDVTKRNDTIDVWIDSGSSSQAVLKKHPALKFPADAYFEGSDQHRGWFQSSLMMSVAVTGQAPYKTVITHGFMVDLDGNKISKSAAYEKPKDSEAFVNKYGADIVRLWVASENYQNDIPLSEEIFTHISESYRSIRNTLRILLANLYDFDAASASQILASLSSTDQLDDLAVDRWMLSRLQGLITEVRKAYDAYEFHRVYQAVNVFCKVEISSLYVDITKDRMYCDEPNSARRRATQAVMHALASSLLRLLAPVLCFTTDEAWGFLEKSGRSIHLETFPESERKHRNEALEKLFEDVLRVRTLVAAELEKARQAKQIGKSVDARVKVQLADARLAERFQSANASLSEIFIVSQSEFVAGPTDQVTLEKPKGGKCARSWRWDETVGSDPDYPELCARDALAVRQFSASSIQGGRVNIQS
jgi:isoleucyl-tRNA synthetase